MFPKSYPGIFSPDQARAKIGGSKGTPKSPRPPTEPCVRVTYTALQESLIQNSNFLVSPLHRSPWGNEGLVRCPSSVLGFSSDLGATVSFEFHLLAFPVPSFAFDLSVSFREFSPPMRHRIFIGSQLYGYYDFIGRLLEDHARITTPA
ncbi:MAG TPA: hypothetical protein VI895_05460 [Bdellovibrionota bacterium]|nr:hypothetical protein [Bdellovibrionota bacterium]